MRRFTEAILGETELASLVRAALGPDAEECDDPDGSFLFRAFEAYMSLS